MKLDLTDVTVCAIDSVNVALAARALHISMTHCEFADAILFSHAPVNGEFRCVTIDRIESIAAYSNFVFKNLPMLVKTPYLLVIQWDGYVTDARAWNPAFREYDYIGARWPNLDDAKGFGDLAMRWPIMTDRMTVGNGGFALHSRKFMSAMMAPEFPLDATVNSDWLVCRNYRPKLERKYGIRFAPKNIADRFSYELTEPKQHTFGFHGMGNMWRHVDDAEMVVLIDQLAPYVCRTDQYARLMMAYFASGQFIPLAALAAKMSANVDAAEMAQCIRHGASSVALAEECVRICNRLLAAGFRNYGDN